MSTALVVIVSVGCGVVCLLAVLKMVFSSLRRKMERKIQEKFNPIEVVGATTRANFFGQRSKGGSQVRGNGALVLTKEEIYFLRAVPEKEYHVPIGSIKEVTLPKSFNGKSIFAPLLCVHYGAGGVEDAMAWAVKDPQKWKDAIEALMAGDSHSASLQH